MSTQVKPVLRISSGETLLVETEDCFSHQITSPEDSLDKDFDYSRVNPSTGPVFVEGVSPGDVLSISIKSITLDATGVTVTDPGWGPLGDQVKASQTKVVAIEGDAAIVGSHRIPCAR